MSRRGRGTFGIVSVRSVLRTTAIFMAASVLVPGCAEEETLTLADGPSPAREASMFRAVLTDLTRPENLPVQGEWPKHFGDANCYGPGLLFRYGAAGQNPLQIDLARQTHGYNTRLLDSALGDLSLMMQKLDHLLMAALGIMEALRHTPDDSVKQKLDSFFEVLNTMGKAISYYPEGSSFDSNYGVQTYGPGSINATLALLNLEYATNVGGAKKDSRVASALAIIDAGRSKGFNTATGYYRFSSSRSGLFLYPNVTQMLAHLRAYQVTGKKLYLDRAKDLHRAISPLKVKGEGRYLSPYSAKTMGAKTDDYTTLSSQNFTLMALSLLYQEIRTAAVRGEVDEILKFIRTHLHKEGRVYHHWMDGRLALPADPEYYCTGCNLQLLYIIWRMEEMLAASPSS